MPIQRVSLQSIASITANSSIYSPVSVIKELLENSIDSKAKSITIELDHQSCGLQFIQVKDNGDGIPTEDRPLAFQNHTTSKISNADDIYSTNTMGFRGEALYFINELTYPQGSIEVSSKSSNDKLGQSWKVGKDGSSLAFKSAAMPQGTIIAIKSIFKKTPVRSKILTKQKSQHIAKLKKMILGYALAHRDIRFHMKFINYKPKEKSNPVISQDIYNSDISQLTILSSQLKCKPSSFIQYDGPLSDFGKVKMILPKMNASSDLTSSTSTIRIISINHRLMNGKLSTRIIKSLNTVYEELKLLNPVMALIEIWFNDDWKLDFNIEPEKDDVLIRDEEMVLRALRDLVMSVVMDGHGMAIVNEEKDKVIITENQIGVEVIHSESDSDPQEVNDIFDEEEHIEAGEVQEPPDKSKSQEQFEEEIPIQNQHYPSRTSIESQSSLGITTYHADPEDEIDWSHNMHDRLSSRTNTTESNNPGQERSNSIDDDESFTIAKDTSISNPFTLTSLQHQAKHNGQLITPDNSLDDILHSKGFKKPPTLRDESQLNEMKQTTLNTGIITTLQKRYKLSSEQYLQSFHMKLSVPKLMVKDLGYDDWVTNGDISSNISSFYDDLENVKLEKRKYWYYIGPE